jgi:hypothetical protein
MPEASRIKHHKSRLGRAFGSFRRACARWLRRFWRAGFAGSCYRAADSTHKKATAERIRCG